MNDEDKKDFAVLMTGVAEAYDKQISKSLLQLYFGALKEFTLYQVSEAISKHLLDPDSGQFMPKPANIVKHISGNTQQKQRDIDSRAEFQWDGSVVRAVREVGSYRTPNFKDPITKAVISTWGWPELCKLTEEQLVWKRKEFIQQYNNYMTRPIEQLPNHIAGLEDIEKVREEQKKTLKMISERCEQQ